MSAKDGWRKEKNWKMVYTRSEKLHRAQQLGIPYPIVTEQQIVDENAVFRNQLISMPQYDSFIQFGTTDTVRVR